MPWVTDEAKAGGGDKAQCKLNQLVDGTDRRENTVVLDFCSCRLICFNCFSNMKLGNSTVSGQPSDQSIQGDVAVEILRASRPRDRTGTGASIEIRMRWGQEPRCPSRFTLLEGGEITWNWKPPSQVDKESAPLRWASGKTTMWNKARGVAGKRRKIIRFGRLRVEHAQMSELALVSVRRLPSAQRSALLPLGRFTGFNGFDDFITFSAATGSGLNSVWSPAVLRIVLRQCDRDKTASPISAA